jgi:hypothetical protein
MLKLFMKDVRAGAIFLWAVVPMYLVVGLQVMGSGSAFFWGNVVCASLIVVGVATIDWKNDAGLFVHSLPVTRALVVRSRYATAAAAGVLALAVGSVLGAVRGLGLVLQGHAWPRWVAADVALAFVLVFAFVVAVYLPCHFRWGFGKGNVAAALVLAVSILAMDLAGSAVSGAAGGSGGGRVSVEVPMGQVPQAVAYLAGRWGLAAAAGVVLGLAAALLWVSARVAVRAARAREF